MADRVFKPRGAAAELFRCHDREILIVGPAGCVAGETELWDPVAKKGRRIDELAWSGTRPWVQTLNGPVLAEAPFLKGWAPLYRVTTSSGASCLATADHLYLTPDGWRFVADLVPGMALLRGLPEGAPHSWQTGADSQSDCRKGRRLYGQQPLSASAVGLASSPSEVDALARNRDGCIGDGRASRPASSPLCPGAARPSMLGSAFPRLVEPSGVSQEEPPSRLGAECRAGRGTGGRSVCWSRPPFQSLQGLPPLPPFEQQSHDFDGTQIRAQASEWSQPCAEYRVRWETVQSVVYERTDAYYDLHVPGEEHYLADGLVSHNTGKSRAVLEKLDAYCEKYPGIRVLICRKVRATLAESVLVTWEEHVLTKGHKAIIGTASPHNRKTYEYPNGSHVVLAGMDEPAKIMSTEYDIIAFFEASDSHRTDIERLLSRLRNHRIPHPEGMYPDGKIEDGRTLREALVDGHFLQWGNKCPDGSPLFLEQLICDTNPADAYHHLHLRAKAGKMRWLKSWHEDNPTVTPEFMANLDSLTGVDYRRLRLGEWITAAGLVYDTWNPEKHLIKQEEIPECDWYFAAMDFGYRPSPGAAGVIGVKGKAEGQKLYVVEEEYRLGKLDDWWAGRIGEWKQKYDLVTVVCDSAEPDRIAKLNQYLNRHTRTTGNIAIGAKKAIRTGIQAVRYYLGDDDSEVMRWEKKGRQGEKPELGAPRLRVCEQTTDVFVDEELVSEGRPTCLEHEITAFRYTELEEGKVVKDLPDPTCVDHAVDWLRYGCLWVYRKNFNREPDAAFEPGTLGDVHNHQTLIDQAKKEERAARSAQARAQIRSRREKRKKRRGDG